jgi:uncharacterized membrane protein YdbT with pleckstrin-like domain
LALSIGRQDNSNLLLPYIRALKETSVSLDKNPVTSRRHKHDSLRSKSPLSRRKIFKKCVPKIGKPLALILVAAFLVTVALRFFYLEDLNDPTHFISRQEFPLSFLFVGLAVWFGSYPLYQYLYWKTYFYDIDDKNLYIRKGVLVRREAILPFSRITDVYLDQDLADLLLGIYDLHVSTPTVESGKFAHIDGLSKMGAQRLKKLLLEKVNQTKPAVPKEQEEQLDYDSQLRKVK